MQKVSNKNLVANLWTVPERLRLRRGQGRVGVAPAGGGGAAAGARGRLTNQR